MGRRRTGAGGSAFVVLLGLIAAGCQTAATSGGSTVSSAWAIDTVRQKCVASVVGGAIVGGIIGAVTGGGRGAAGGAVIGSVAGVGLCGVIMALDAQDRDRIRQAQLLAAETGEPQVLAYQGGDGLQRNITVRPGRKVMVKKEESGRRTIVDEAAPVTDAAVVSDEGRETCTEVLTSAAIETKGTTDVPVQTICRGTDGTYTPTVLASASQG